MHFIVFVPAYNARAARLSNCLLSVLSQEYTNYEVVFVDDASDDGTGEVMEMFAQKIRDNGAERNWPRVKASVIHNTENMKMPRNLLQVRNYGSPEDVVVILDGDDWFPHPDTLRVLEKHWDNSPEIWLTYGSFLFWPDPYRVTVQALPYPDEVIAANSFRQVNPHYNHPVVFKRHLLDRIEDWELQHDDGTWFGAAYDHAIMMPMLELASRGHFKWVPDFLYVYNDSNPISEVRTTNEGERVHTTVNARSPREPL